MSRDQTGFLELEVVVCIPTPLLPGCGPSGKLRKLLVPHVKGRDESHSPLASLDHSASLETFWKSAGAVYGCPHD